jgi:hypothetical protein
MARKYLELRSLDELAMAYALLARDDYDSQTFAGDAIDIQRAHLKHEMQTRFQPYDAQEAIKRAHETLKIVAFHQDK